MLTKAHLRTLGLQLTVFFPAVLALLGGCATKRGGWQAYSGPPRPRNEIAVLRCEYTTTLMNSLGLDFHHNQVCPVSVDGHSTLLHWDGSSRRKFFWRLRGESLTRGERPDFIELPPGAHKVLFYPPGALSADNIELEVTVEAGKSYTAYMGEQIDVTAGNISRGHWWVNVLEDTKEK